MEYINGDPDKLLDRIENNIPINDNFNEVELDQLKELSTHEDECIRSRVAEILVDFTEEKGEQILINLIKDSDSLVRTEACDSLKYSNSHETYKLLSQVAYRDSNGMVRGYAVSSLGEISKRIGEEKETVKYLKELLKREKVVFTRINLFKELYSLGEEQYLGLLLDCIDSKVYRNRCASINSLKEIIKSENKKIIMEALIARNKIEKTRAVKSSIESLIENM